MRSVCVFCGSSRGGKPEYRLAARALGAMLAARGLRLVYGGARVGLMGELADEVRAAGGNVVGVIPESLQAREVAHTDLPDLRVVSSMHERKALMADLADAFVALPGGAGTLEELFEVWTWAQLGIHHKPCGLLDVAGYFDGLLGFLDHAVKERFIRIEHRAMMLVDDDPARLLDRRPTIGRRTCRSGWTGGKCSELVEPGGIAPPSENAYRRNLRACLLLKSRRRRGEAAKTVTDQPRNGLVASGRGARLQPAY